MRSGDKVASGKVRNLDLHEAMVLVMLEQKLRMGTTEMTTSDLAREIRKRELYFQKAGGFADASQLGARARQYPALFSAMTRRGAKRLLLNELPRRLGTLIAEL